MKENRYFRIIYLLLQKGCLPAPQLAAALEVSLRTVYRDINNLSAAGVPIFCVAGRHGGVKIADNFVLDKSLLSAGEQQTILSALHNLSVAAPGEVDALLTKLGAVFSLDHNNWVEIDLSDWYSAEFRQATFTLLRQAITAKTVVTFLYHNSKGNCETRTVEPLRLVYKSHDWYLYSFCRSRADFRFFKLNRIRQAEATTIKFTRSLSGSLLTQKPELRIKTLAVTLRFTPQLSYRVYDEFTAGISVQPDGSFLVRTELPDNEFLYSYLGSFGDQLEVIEPHSLRQKMLKIAENLQNIYKP